MIEVDLRYFENEDDSIHFDLMFTIYNEDGNHLHLTPNKLDQIIREYKKAKRLKQKLLEIKKAEKKLAKKAKNGLSIAEVQGGELSEAE